MEGSDNFSLENFSVSVASSDPCRKRVDDSNTTQQKTEHDMAAKTDINVGCSFDESLKDKPEPKINSSQISGTTSTTPQAEQPAAWNPVALDGSVNHSLCSKQVKCKVQQQMGLHLA